MKITCPEHSGLIYADLNFFNRKNVALREVLDCPVCDEEVLIDGVFDIDSEGLAIPAGEANSVTSHQH